MPSEVLIELKDIGMRYGTQWALRDVNLSVRKGDFLAISGPNGGGKTTLLRIMLKLLKPTVGRVQYFCDCQRCNDLAVGYLPQKSSIDLRFPITVRETVLSGLLKGWRLRLPADADEKLREVTETLGVDTFLDKNIGDLSGGQLQRTLLARALVSHPEIIVLDEPLSYVDKHFEYQIYNIMERLAQTSTIILVSHEMTVISRMANRHIIVAGGIEECHASKHGSFSNCYDTTQHIKLG